MQLHLTSSCLNVESQRTSSTLWGIFPFVRELIWNSQSCPCACRARMGLGALTESGGGCVYSQKKRWSQERACALRGNRRNFTAVQTEKLTKGLGNRWGQKRHQSFCHISTVTVSLYQQQRQLQQLYPKFMIKPLQMVMSKLSNIRLF